MKANEIDRKKRFICIGLSVLIDILLLVNLDITLNIFVYWSINFAYCIPFFTSQVMNLMLLANMRYCKYFLFFTL